MEVQCAKIQAQAHLNRLIMNEDFNYSMDNSESSNVREFRSFHANHIKHDVFIFQMSDECFPSRFLQPNRRYITVKGITHWTLNIWKTSLHKAYTTPQWRSGPLFPHRLLNHFLSIKFSFSSDSN